MRGVDVFVRNRKLRDAYRNIFDGNNVSGEAVLSDLYNCCRMGKPTYCVGDPYQTAYNEGLRAVFLHIFSLMNADEKRLAELERESQEASK